MMFPLLAATLLMTALQVPAATTAPPAPPAAATPATPATPPRARDESLPASEAQAKAALDHSPRHGEYVDVKSSAGGAAIRTWVMYPERKDKAGVVLVIHEVFGLSDWARAVADQLAMEGFIAVVPDLVSGMGPNGKGSDSSASRDDVVALVRALTPAEATARLNAVRDYAIHLPAANGKLATVGFCWGGGRSFAYAVSQPALAAAVVYYGTPPEAAEMAKIKAPIVGFYGGDDARVTATVAATETEMRKAGKSYEPHIFAGAGHGFLRAQDDRNGANLKAAQQAWPRTVAFLREQLQ
jgi:carboxymethylenebutenolidase